MNTAVWRINMRGCRMNTAVWRINMGGFAGWIQLQFAWWIRQDRGMNKAVWWMNTTVCLMITAVWWMNMTDWRITTAVWWINMDLSPPPLSLPTLNWSILKSYSFYWKAIEKNEQFCPICHQKDLIFSYFKSKQAKPRGQTVLPVISRRDNSSLPVCSVSCTVHLQLFTNIDIP